MKKLLDFVRRQWIARPLAVCSGCFLLGMLFFETGDLPVIVILCAAAICIAMALTWRKCRYICIIGIIAAFLLGGVRIRMALNAHPPVTAQYSVEFDGKVVSDPVYNAESERIICKFQLSHVDGTAVRDCVRLYLRSDEVPLEGIEYGQQLKGVGHIWPQDVATNPYEFDSRKWLLANGMTGMAAAKLEDVAVFPASPSLGRWMICVRRAIADRIQLLFPQNAELVQAFVLGDRSGLTDDLRENFRRTGIMHLICISGMHISVLAGAMSLILHRWLPRNAAVLLALGLIAAYGVLVGFPASLVRAGIMFAVFSLAPLAGRVSDPITRLFAALLGMLLFNPFYIYDGGFVLSFWASAGIMLLEPPLSSLLGVDRLKERKFSHRRIKRLIQRIIRYFPSLLSTTLAVQIAMLPIVIANFGAQSLISVPVNLIAVPLAMIAYPLALLALCLSVIWIPLGAMAAALPDALFSLLTASVALFAGLPIGEFRVPCYPAWLFGIHCALLIAASGLSCVSLLHRRLFVVPLLLLLGVSMLNAWIASLGFQVVFLDAGQADAAVVRADGRVALFDVGDPYSPSADYVSATCLQVDAIFLTHPHYDHAGGLTELLRSIPPKRIYVPAGWFDVEADESVYEGIQLAQEMGIPITELSVGDQVTLSDEVTVRVHAPNGSATSVNDLSLMLEVTRYGKSVLFTGDISAKAEPDFIPDIDILKVAHHGSRYATSQRFLTAASPEFAVISVGDNNYGHPSEEVLMRLNEENAEVYRTDQCGAITMNILKDGEISVKTYLPKGDFQ